ncbi:tripartite motif-containing protein 2-like isoform X4 [Thrips palmi]|uniref:Tripartite motif-containing protein 2-like isoform X4 n=1 Tax=Thrips palmi TaxID=161013 RepID=A0A6P8YLZ7_THRPL|nr:tripartite motif-containing protein 2-like isoform X4 [Thrips palmi]
MAEATFQRHLVYRVFKFLAGMMLDSLQRSLECEVCYEQFNLAARRPKLLSCGHTVCLRCVVLISDKARNARNDAETSFLCPIDRKETRRKPEELNDNYYILSLMQEPPKREKKSSLWQSVAKTILAIFAALFAERGVVGGNTARFWCLDCQAVADRVCEDEHALRRLQQERAQQMKPTLDVLERAVSTQRRLAKELDTVEDFVIDFVQQQVSETTAAALRGQEALQRLYDGLDLVGPEWDLVEAEVEKARQESEDRLAADELSLQVAETGKWDAAAGLGADGHGTAVVRGLLLHVQRANLLRLNKEDVTQHDNEEADTDTRSPGRWGREVVRVGLHVIVGVWLSVAMFLCVFHS